MTKDEFNHAFYGQGVQSTGYAGRRLDDESWLAHFRARYFDSELGRFISRDPLNYIDGMNLYRGYFVPRGVDPWGMTPDLVLTINTPYDSLDSESYTGIMSPASTVNSTTSYSYNIDNDNNDSPFICNFVSVLPESVWETVVSGEAADSLAGSVQASVGYTGDSGESLYGNEFAFQNGQANPEYGAVAVNSIAVATAIMIGVGNADLLSAELWGMGNNFVQQYSSGNGTINVTQIINGGTGGVVGSMVSQGLGGNGSSPNSAILGGALSNGTGNFYSQFTSGNDINYTQTATAVLTGAMGGIVNSSLQNAENFMTPNLSELQSNLIGNAVTSSVDYIIFIAQ